MVSGRCDRRFPKRCRSNLGLLRAEDHIYFTWEFQETCSSNKTPKCFNSYICFDQKAVARVPNRIASVLTAYFMKRLLLSMIQYKIKMFIDIFLKLQQQPFQNSSNNWTVSSAYINILHFRAKWWVNHSLEAKIEEAQGLTLAAHQQKYNLHLRKLLATAKFHVKIKSGHHSSSSSTIPRVYRISNSQEWFML